MKANMAFAGKQGFPFPLLCDVDRAIGLAYGACDTVDASSARRITYVIGEDGAILQAHAKVDAGSHPGTLLEGL
jgi:peroxiredoxin Q/BCP